jgi:hypothetical protein
MQVDEAQFYSSGRYFPIEPDGKQHGYQSYTQRPAAERKLRHGVGLYDRKEHRVIVEPDPAKFLIWLSDQRQVALREAEKLGERIAELRE